MRMARRLAKHANVKKQDRPRLGGKSLDLPVKTGLRFDAFTLKLIAITAMAVDHITPARISSDIVHAAAA